MTFPVQSTKTLIKASAAAVVIALVIFTTIVLPVEYNSDPTGVGKLLGLTVLAKQDPAVDNGQKINEKPVSLQKHQATILVPANSGVEYKFQMTKHADISYEWYSQGKPIYFDFHGEPEGDTSGYFKSYTIATAAEVQGSMTVPFDGIHGWYWKNISDQDVTITLKTEGNYEVVGLIH